MPLTGMYCRGQGQRYPLRGAQPCESHAHAAKSSHRIGRAPLLDSAITLLVFFIVLAVSVEQPGLEAGRPATDSSAPTGAIACATAEVRLGSLDDIAFTATLFTEPK